MPWTMKNIWLGSGQWLLLSRGLPRPCGLMGCWIQFYLDDHKIKTVIREIQESVQAVKQSLGDP